MAVQFIQAYNDWDNTTEENNDERTERKSPTRENTHMQGLEIVHNGENQEKNEASDDADHGAGSDQNTPEM